MRIWHAMTPKETAEKVIGWLPSVVGCPGTEHLLEEALQPAENYVLLDDDECLAWMAFTKADHRGSWLLDIAARPDVHGKWMTRDVIKKAGQIIFKGRSFVLLENSKGKALKFALRMGANPIMIHGKKDMYLLSKASFKGGLQ